MTKKDYQMLAKVIGVTREEALARSWPFVPTSRSTPIVENVVGSLLVHLCNALRQENSRFDEDRFYAAVYKK